MKKIIRTLMITSGFLVCFTFSSTAGEVGSLHTFVPHTPAKASEVNDNFTAVKTAVNNNDSRITANENEISALYSNYFYFEGLNQGSVTVSAAWTELNTDGPHSFTKENDNTIVEVQVNSRFKVGSFSDASVIRFQVRIDGTISPNIGNYGSIISDNTYEFLSIYNVFQDLSKGTHTISIWAKTNSGTSTDVGVDPGGCGGGIIVKETW